MGPLGIDPFHLEVIGNDLNKTPYNAAAHYEFILRPVFELNMSCFIFGESWQHRSDHYVHTNEAFDFITDLFKPDEVFSLTKSMDDGSGFFESWSLKNQHLSGREIKDFLQRAEQYYEIFEFSKLHYAKLGTNNIFTPLLFKIMQTATLLGSNKFKRYVNVGYVHRYSNGDENISQGYQVDNHVRPELKCVLSNIYPKTHGKMLSKNDKIRYMIDPFCNFLHFMPASLLDIIEKSKI